MHGFGLDIQLALQNMQQGVKRRIVLCSTTDMKIGGGGDKEEELVEEKKRDFCFFARGSWISQRACAKYYKCTPTESSAGKRKMFVRKLTMQFPPLLPVVTLTAVTLLLL